MQRKITNEIEFSIRILRDNNVTPEEYSKLLKMVPDQSTEYVLVKRKKSFYSELAQALIKLWPSGMKDGKYPWRDSVENIAERLDTIWAMRNLGERTIDECLVVARRYLAKYTEDTKFMMLLKYFIFKQDKILGPEGKYRITYKSMFADMLEGKIEEDAALNEWDTLLATENFGEGELVC